MGIYVTGKLTKIQSDLADDAFRVDDGKAFLLGYTKNADFPGEYGKKTRGEIFQVNVPQMEQKKGKGLGLCIYALNHMKKNGTKTVNMNPTTKEGKALLISLIHNGFISQPIKISDTGKMEFRIL